MAHGFGCGLARESVGEVGFEMVPVCMVHVVHVSVSCVAVSTGSPGVQKHGVFKRYSTGVPVRTAALPKSIISQSISLLRPHGAQHTLSQRTARLPSVNTSSATRRSRHSVSKDGSAALGQHKF